MWTISGNNESLWLVSFSNLSKVRAGSTTFKGSMTIWTLNKYFMIKYYRYSNTLNKYFIVSIESQNC